MAKRKKSPRKVGRPKFKINIELARSLANIQCTLTEVAGVMGCCITTLSNSAEFMEAYNKGIETGKASLRRLQYRLAEKSAGMAIWLGKQYLNQVEKVEITNNELMGEELEILTNSSKYNGRNRVARFINA